MFARGITSALICAIAIAADAQEPKPSKSDFSLFNPTPSALMRDFESDRPDQTESPYTVDAGHFQIEMDLVNYTRDRVNPEHANRRSQSFLVADPTLKIGLLNNLDIQLVLTPWLWQRDEDRDLHVTRTRSGIGATALRLKWNVWGNDDADEWSTSFGLLPYVKFPTNTDRTGNRFTEGGLILPFTLRLPGDAEIDAMTEFDVFHNGASRGDHLEWVNSIALHKDLIKDRLNAYVEFYSSVSREPHTGPLETVDFGALYALAPNVQLDAGVNFGVSRRANDINPFLGLSLRF